MVGSRKEAGHFCHDNEDNTLDSGFSLTQLVELMRMPEDRARLRVAEHDWTLTRKPDVDKTWQNKESEATGKPAP
jgi:hypothetical protein